MVPTATENYYQYNVGEGGVWQWDDGRQEMIMTEWKAQVCLDNLCELVCRTSIDVLRQRLGFSRTGQG